MKGSYILSGIIGSTIVILILITIIVWLKPFNYQAIYVVNSEIISAKKTDSLTCNQLAVLKDLEKKGILLTPQDYTSHISDYYSTLIAFLIGLFVLFTIGSIYGMRITSRKEMEEAKEDLRQELKTSLAEELKDSRVFYENIISDILGRVEDDLLKKTDKEAIDRSIDEISRKQIEQEENLNLLFDVVDAKSEIKS